MIAQRTSTLTYFGPLFLTALAGWLAFNVANGGTLHFVPGVVVAALIAYGGTLVARRARLLRDVRAVSPQAQPARRYAGMVAPRGSYAVPTGEPLYEMDIAAGD